MNIHSARNKNISNKIKKNFHEQDFLAAKNFGRSAKKAGVKQLIYLGGLGNPESELSQHLRSRQATGDVLRQSNIAVTEFRAAVIVGSGSLSFEMIRYLTERVPVMICPSWVYTKAQPIAISDVIRYLVSALETRECRVKIIEIGGSDVITYRQMMFGILYWYLLYPIHCLIFRGLILKIAQQAQ